MGGATAAVGLGFVIGPLVGCAGREGFPGTPSTPTGNATPDPDVRLAGRALAAEKRQLALLASVSRRFPALAGRLRDTRTVHQQHVDLLTDAAPAQATPSSPPAASPVQAPASRAAALRAVVEGERTLLGRHRAAATAARSGGFARVLAGMAAASAQQAAVLGEPG
jgi:hypothetical protein